MKKKGGKEHKVYAGKGNVKINVVSDNPVSYRIGKGDMRPLKGKCLILSSRMPIEVFLYSEFEYKYKIVTPKRSVKEWLISLMKTDYR